MEAIIVYCLVPVFFVALGLVTATILLKNPYRAPEPVQEPEKSASAKKGSKSVYAALAVFLASVLAAFIKDRKRARD